MIELSGRMRAEYLLLGQGRFLGGILAPRTHGIVVWEQDKAMLGDVVGYWWSSLHVFAACQPTPFNAGSVALSLLPF